MRSLEDDDNAGEDDVDSDKTAHHVGNNWRDGDDGANASVIIDLL